MFRISAHAQQRIASRRFTVEELLAALDGRQERLASGLTIHYDPASRCALVVDMKAEVIVTALRRKRGKYRKTFARDGERGRDLTQEGE